MEEDRIYRPREDHLLGPIIDETEAWKLVVPQEYRDKVLCDAHREMYHFVEEYDDCQRCKTLQTAPKGLMGQRIVERPWAMVADDCMEFPLSKCQYKNVVVF